MDVKFREWLLDRLEQGEAEEDATKRIAIWGACSAALVERGLSWREALLKGLDDLDEDPPPPIVPPEGGDPRETLRFFVLEIEQLMRSRNGVSADIRQFYNALKEQGFEPGIVRQIIRNRKGRVTAKERELMELYESYLEGMEAGPKRGPAGGPAQGSLDFGNHDEIGEDFGRVEEIVEAALARSLSAFERDFCEQMRENLTQYGSHTWVSPKQWEVLERLEEENGAA
jgi:uncharacterized protein (UPF0335 family)